MNLLYPLVSAFTFLRPDRYSEVVGFPALMKNVYQELKVGECFL